MKKKIFGAIAILAIAAAFSASFNIQKNDMSLLSLSNIEALANSESGSKEMCRQTVTPWRDPLNGTKCRDFDRYKEVNVSGSRYLCEQGSSIGGNGCKEGIVKTGNDCNNSYNGSTMDLKNKC